MVGGERLLLRGERSFKKITKANEIILLHSKHVRGGQLYGYTARSAQRESSRLLHIQGLFRHNISVQLLQAYAISTDLLNCTSYVIDIVQLFIFMQLSN